MTTYSPQPVRQHHPADDDIISLSEILGILNDGKRQIAAITLIFALLSLIYIQVTEPVYQADSLLQINDSHEDAVSNSVTLASEIEILRSDNILSQAIGSLFERPDSGFAITAGSREDALKALRGNLKVSSGKNSNLITISYSGTDRGENQAILNSVIIAYRQWSDQKTRKLLESRLNTLEQQITLANDELGRTEAAVTAFRTESGGTTLSADAQQTFVRLSSDVETAKEIHLRLLEQQQQLEINLRNKDSYIQVVDLPENSIDPIKPKKALIVVLATLLGGMLGTGLVFVREMLNQGVKTREELESKTGLPVLAAIPEHQPLNKSSKQSAGELLLKRSNEFNPTLESLRSLRTNLTFALTQADNNRVMLTSPTEGSGKTFISANLASLLAESGRRVLLIDTDLRHGHLHKTFQLANDLSNDKGLAQWLAGSAGKKSIQCVSDNLDVLTAGQYPENPSELLMSNAFAQLLDEVSGSYDVVILDAPSSLTVTDPAIIGQHCATNLVAVRARHNPIKDVLATADRLSQAGVNMSGYVLNGLA